MKQLIFSIILLVTLNTFANAQSTRFVGTWLATDGDNAYKITFSPITLISNNEPLEFLGGAVTYLQNGNVVHATTIDGENSLLLIPVSMAGKPDPTTNSTLVSYSDTKRNSFASFDVTISNDNQTLQWTYNKVMSLDFQQFQWMTKGNKNKMLPPDIPNNLTFKRVSQ